MTNKKYLIIAVLATFCLTATLFMFLPTRSQSNNYDPWTDVNGDGTIDMADISMAIDGFMSSGDTTKPVNVTTTPAKMTEMDLNISILGQQGYGWGRGSTDSFATEGYDRMFVSAAITNARAYPTFNSTYVWLTGAIWYMGTVKGTVINYSTPVDYNRRITMYAWNSSYLPACSDSSSEFAVEAAQCSLEFNASTMYDSGWVLVHVWVYLTSGTTSPPPVQETLVTNWPTFAPQPSCSVPSSYLNVSSGPSNLTAEFYCGGYSRMAISAWPGYASNGTYDVELGVYGIRWGEAQW